MNKGFAAVSLFLAILTMSLGISACSSDNSGLTDSVVLGTVLQEPSIPVFIAEEQQFFQQNRLNVSMKIYDSGAQSILGVLNGEVDLLAPTSEYVLVNQILGNQDIKTIGCIDKLEFIFVIARKDHQIAAVSDLKGKKIGLVSGTATEFFLNRFLTLSGVGSRDVNLVEIATRPELDDAIIRGGVDAIVTVSPYAEEVAKTLGDQAISWPAQGGQMIYLLAVAKGEWISAHSSVVQRFLKALDQAEAFILQHPEESAAIVKKRLGFTDELMSDVWERNQFSLSLEQSLILVMEDEARWMISNNLTTEKTVPNFLDYIYADGLKSVKPDAVRIAGK